MRRLVISAVLASCLVWGSTSAADETIGASAREHFKAGVLLLQDPDGARYEEAYREFVAAYAASPSPKILGNLGFCAMKLERDAEAIAAYSRYLAEVADIDADEREQMKRDVATMKTGLVRISVTVDIDGASVIDSRVPVHGTPMVNVYGPVHKTIELGVRAGHHTIRAEGPTGQSTPWEIDATPGASLAHAFVTPRVIATDRPPAPVPEGGGSRVVPWLVTGLGAAALVGGAVAGGLVMKKVNQLEATCPNNECPAGSNLESQRDSARLTMHVADGLLIGGGAALVTGVVWLLLSGGPSSRSPVERGAPPPAQAAFICGPTGCMARIGGRF